MHRDNRESADLRDVYLHALRGHNVSHFAQRVNEDDEFWQLPLNLKNVPRVCWHKMDNFMEGSRWEPTYHKAKHKMMSPNLLSKIPKTNPWRANISDSDLAESIRLGVVRPLHESETPKGFVQLKTVAEKRDQTGRPTRRRLLVVPWDHNDFLRDIDYVPLCTVEEIGASLHTEGAACLDIAACYTHYPLPPEAQPYYSFMFRDHWYCVQTIPTGGRHCPALAQTILLAIRDHLLEDTRCGNITADAYIDNIRICGPSAHVTLAVRILMDICEHLDIRMNIESNFAATYTFLGVVCTHASNVDFASTKTAIKTTQKLQEARNKILEQDATLLDGFRMLGLLMWCSRIADIQLFDFYGPLKFFRRRAATGGKLDSPLGLWPCVIDDLLAWIRQAQLNKPRACCAHTENDTTCVMYTDASNRGYGALIVTNHKLHICCGTWCDTDADLHINVKEAKAVSIGLSRLLGIVVDPGVHLLIRVDNTTVCHIFEKGYSKSHALNAWRSEMATLMGRFKTVRMEWISTIKNLADAPSRANITMTASTTF